MAADLEEAEAISNGSIFRVGADYAGKTSLLKAGSFLIEEGTSMEEITEIITVGGRSTCGTEVLYRVGVTGQKIEIRELDPATNKFIVRSEFDPAIDPETEDYAEVREEGDTRYRIALAEGVTSWQIVEALKSAEFLLGEVEEVPAEGSLAPDSYEVSPGSVRTEILAEMAERQTERLQTAWAAKSADLPIETPEEALVLASIIEKETGNAEERFDVASVFVNRLNQGMKLQTDPTVIYGVTKGQGTLGRGLRQSELRRETPWNTYVIEGLPPTPIANPGEAAIEAALNPSETDYIFFVAKTLNPSDGHLFAQTLDEHNTNVAAYRKLEAERDN